MKNIFTIIFLLNALTFGQNIHFNEIRSNDSGTDDIEFIELVGPAGTNLMDTKLYIIMVLRPLMEICGHIQ